jgi:hypothetical protein
MSGAITQLYLFNDSKPLVTIEHQSVHALVGKINLT